MCVFGVQEMKHDLCRNPDELKIIIKTALTTPSTANYSELRRVVSYLLAPSPLPHPESPWLLYASASAPSASTSRLLTQGA